jgi:hypothetical protein
MLRQLFGNSALAYSRRLSNLIMAKRYEIASREAERDLRLLHPRLHRYLELQIAEQGANHFFSSYKLWELACLLEELKPELVVEFGSGSTTAAFAEYAECHTNCRVISVDEHSPYQDEVFARLERAGFGLNGNIIKCPCPKIVEIRNGIDVTRYEPKYLEHFSGSAPDLAYVDGPTTNHPEKHKANMPCIDVLFMCDQSIFPRYVAYDFRIPSVRALLESPYRLEYQAQLHHSVKTAQEEPWAVAPARHHSQFRLINTQELARES